MRKLRNRVLVSIVAVTLVCAMGTTAQAGVVPWLWNFMFGPANAPLFPRRRFAARPFVARPFVARRFARPINPAYGYAPPTIAYAPPAVGWSPAAVSYAPAYTASAASWAGCGTCSNYSASYAPSYPAVSYSPVVTSSCCGSTSFEYSGYTTNGCGTVYSGTIISDGPVSSPVTDGSVTGGSGPDYETPGSTPEVTDPPSIEDDRPAPGTGMGDDDDEYLPPRGMDTAPANDPLDEIDLEGFGETNKPVLEDQGEEAPSTNAPGPDAKRIRTLPVTVSLKGQLGRFTQLRRTMTRTRLSESRKTLQWISVPSDGRKVRM